MANNQKTGELVKDEVEAIVTEVATDLLEKDPASAEAKVKGVAKDVVAGAVAAAEGAVKAVEEALLTTVKGYPLFDHTQGVTIPATDSVKAKVTDWVKAQIKAGLVRIVQ